MGWLAAQSDWDRLMAICASSPGVAPLASKEVVNAWQKRREECNRQLAASHYDVMEVPRLSSIEEVKRSYRDLARRWHPDKHQHKAKDHQERAGRRFTRIREAYEVLSEEVSKRQYDAILLLRDAQLPDGGATNGV